MWENYVKCVVGSLGQAPAADELLFTSEDKINLLSE